jgi:hypothetical protein
MSDINLDFTVSNNSIDFTVQPNDITITPEEIQLIFTSGSTSVPGGTNTQLQYNNNGALAGIPNVTFNGSNISLGNVSTVKITGGINGYVLQTDGTGNLDWTAQTGGGGNGSPGGSNTQIQYNDNGLFGGNTGFTFNEVNGNVDIPGNLNVIGNIVGIIANANFANFAGNVTVSTQPNITSVGTLINLAVAGNISTTGTTSVQQAKEKITLNNSAATGIINYNLLDQAIILQNNNASNNFTLNFRGNSSVTLDSVMLSNQSMTCTFINKNGFPAYYANSLQIDGNVIIAQWANGAAPTAGTTNAYDSYSFNIIKTASNSFVLFASAGSYY